jgi:hypothetical protein
MGSGSRSNETRARARRWHSRKWRPCSDQPLVQGRSSILRDSEQGERDRGNDCAEIRQGHDLWEDGRFGSEAPKLFVYFLTKKSYGLELPNLPFLPRARACLKIRGPSVRLSLSIGARVLPRADIAPEASPPGAGQASRERGSLHDIARWYHASRGMYSREAALAPSLRRHAGRKVRLAVARGATVARLPCGRRQLRAIARRSVGSVEPLCSLPTLLVAQIAHAVGSSGRPTPQKKSPELTGK